MIKQFRKSFVKSMKIIVSEKYTMKNVTNEQKLRQFAQIIIKATKSAELFVYNQLQIIWNVFDVKFQRNIFMFKTFITFSDFFIAMNKRKKIWWKLIESCRQNFDKKKKFFAMKKNYEREQKKMTDISFIIDMRVSKSRAIAIVKRWTSIFYNFVQIKFLMNTIFVQTFSRTFIFRF